jgi:hypothetical protein|tara:strand:- start:3586 stop:3756 length:171 start_codon:yes stop_codon:yes gene_type:complete
MDTGVWKQGYYAGVYCDILQRPQPRLAIQGLVKTVLLVVAALLCNFWKIPVAKPLQ